jgi:hypothetical protein
VYFVMRCTIGLPVFLLGMIVAPGRVKWHKDAEEMEETNMPPW